MNSKIPVGVSQCLLGERVRFDGGHKRSRYITDELSQYFEFLGLCPEVAIGLGTPRQPIRLVASEQGTQVRGTRDVSLDVTQPLADYAKQVTADISPLCGYIFMQKSPSCGVFSVKRYNNEGQLVDNDGRGAFAEVITRQFPLLPVEEAGRLNDARLRENFITRVYAYHDWRTHVESDPSAKRLLDFYSRYKYQVMAHDLASYRKIGPVLANLKTTPIVDACNTFITLFMAALSHKVTRKGNTNTLMHLRGYLKTTTSRDEKAELGELIEQYREGLVPLVVPLTLLKHHLRKIDDPYLQQQTFWSPHPEVLGLRNTNEE
ncbi:YbgA family protein [Gilvimarinus polysaccharolyticus]|uniref:YbgA family protein n=1 Tax=Gilvimarinus polysaccharolyticus TaxID=863921 RepID=UPI00067318E4|nr:DUF523 and DUF1722 domain-containing protein [Gilvimarinus polysaccharolyticus]